MTATAPAVFITVPKYVAISPHPTLTTSPTTLAKMRPIIPTASAVVLAPASPSGSTSSSCGTVDDGAAPRGKKRRLDHLTWEEKVQRKKLKNRVAAQTSRDRKKARMEEMEYEIKELNEKTEILQNKCESLQTINDSLMEKNQKLDMELETLRQQLTDLQQQQSFNNNNNTTTTTVVATCAGCESILNGSAVSTYTDPLQQGSTLYKDSQSTQEASLQQEQQQQLKKNANLASLWRIVALCLLYKTCSSPSQHSASKRSTIASMPGSWKNLPKVYSQISQQTWRQAIERAQRLLPKLQAEQSDCLDQWWGPQQSAWNPANIAAKAAA